MPANNQITTGKPAIQEKALKARNYVGKAAGYVLGSRKRKPHHLTPRPGANCPPFKPTNGDRRKLEEKGAVYVNEAVEIRRVIRSVNSA